MKVYCAVCNKRCKGEVLKVQDQFVHKKCFKCHNCDQQLESSGFFVRDGKYLCPNDYQHIYGVKCHICGQFVVGELVTALGNTFHSKCFKCSSCKTEFSPGDSVTLWSGQHMCGACATTAATRHTKQSKNSLSTRNGNTDTGQVLLNGDDANNEIALRKTSSIVANQPTSQWKSTSHRHNGHGHSGDMTTDTGYTSGDSILDDKSKISNLYISTCHQDELQQEVCRSSYSSGSMPINTAYHRGVDDRPPRVRRHRRPGEPLFRASFGQHLNQSYLSIDERYGGSSVTGGSISSYANGNRSSSLYRRQQSEPLSAYPPRSSHYHYPESSSHCSSHRSHRHCHAGKAMSYAGSTASTSRKGMQALADYCRRKGSSLCSGSGASAPRTPPSIAALNGDDDPITQSCYPAAHRPEKDCVSAIERDDWPAPQFTALVLAQIMREKRAWRAAEDSLDSGSLCSKSMASSMDSRMESEIASLCNSERSGMCQALLKDFEESRKRRNRSPSLDLDPWLASRTPAANKHSSLKPRFQTPYGMSPSRDLRRSQHQENHVSQHLSYPSSGNRATSLPYGCPASCCSSSARTLPPNDMVPAHRPAPRPGYTHTTNYSKKASSLPPRAYTRGRSVDLHGRVSPCGTISQYSVDLDRSLVLEGSQDDAISEMATITPSSSTVSNVVRRQQQRQRSEDFSLEDLSYPYILGLHKTPSLLNKACKAPPKIYDYDQLKVTNFQLPKGVDRNCLEKHLSLEAFRLLFKMEPTKFSRLPEWKQNDLKRKVELF